MKGKKIEEWDRRGKRDLGLPNLSCMPSTHQAILLDMTSSPKKTYTHPYRDQKCYTLFF